MLCEGLEGKAGGRLGQTFHSMAHKQHHSYKFAAARGQVFRADLSRTSVAGEIPQLSVAEWGKNAHGIHYQQTATHTTFLA
jgi:hypothetical protein